MVEVQAEDFLYNHKLFTLEKHLFWYVYSLYRYNSIQATRQYR